MISIAFEHAGSTITKPTIISGAIIRIIRLDKCQCVNRLLCRKFGDTVDEPRGSVDCQCIFGPIGGDADLQLP